MNTGPIIVRLHFAWWFTWLYVPGIYAMAMLGFEPNVERLVAVTQRAMRYSRATLFEVEA